MSSSKHGKAKGEGPSISSVKQEKAKGSEKPASEPEKQSRELGKEAGGPEKNSGRFNLSENAKWLIIGVILVALIFLALPFFSAEREVSKQEFEKTLSSAQKIALVFDVRGAPSAAARQKIFQCGTDLAGSPALVAGKDLEIVSYEGDRCIFSFGEKMLNYTLAQCENEKLAGRVRLEIAYGNNYTKFYSDRAKLYLNENYTGSCVALAVSANASA